MNGTMILRRAIGVAVAVLGLAAAPQTSWAAGMDGHWSGALSGQYGSGQADIVISGQSATYSYRGGAVPVGWAKVTAATATFGNPLFKLTLKKDGSASFVSSKIGDADGAMSRQ